MPAGRGPDFSLEIGALERKRAREDQQRQQNISNAASIGKNIRAGKQNKLANRLAEDKLAQQDRLKDIEITDPSLTSMFKTKSGEKLTALDMSGTAISSLMKTILAAKEFQGAEEFSALLKSIGTGQASNYVRVSDPLQLAGPKEMKKLTKITWDDMSGLRGDL